MADVQRIPEAWPSAIGHRPSAIGHSGANRPEYRKSVQRLRPDRGASPTPGPWLLASIIRELLDLPVLEIHRRAAAQDMDDRHELVALAAADHSPSDSR